MIIADERPSAARAFSRFPTYLLMIFISDDRGVAPRVFGGSSPPGGAGESGCRGGLLLERLGATEVEALGVVDALGT
jgi:hypothetical protein